MDTIVPMKLLKLLTPLQQSTSYATATFLIISHHFSSFLIISHHFLGFSVKPFAIFCLNVPAISTATTGSVRKGDAGNPARVYRLAPTGLLAHA